jgi:hypothetical protein
MWKLPSSASLPLTAITLTTLALMILDISGRSNDLDMTLIADFPARNSKDTASVMILIICPLM